VQSARDRRRHPHLMHDPARPPGLAMPRRRLRLARPPAKSGARRGRARGVRRALKRLKPFLAPDLTFLEVGCGDAVLSSALAPHVARSYALDVTDALIDRRAAPENLQILLTSGTEIPLPGGSVDIALSDQLIEHLHPDDARVQLEHVVRVLKPGGTYHCRTPNSVTGPHDISCYFDYAATGFHLREYDSRTIEALFKQAGFRRIRFYAAVPQIAVPLPARLVRAIERALLALPRAPRAAIGRNRIVRALAGLDVIATR
jgi:SAM-dependent methyltransferase